MKIEDPAVIPIAVVTAVGIFLAREFVEGMRRRSTNRRKVAAIRELLTAECERNNYTILSMIQIADTTEEALAAGDEITIEYPHTGRERVSVLQQGEDFAGSSPLPKVHAAILDKYLFEIAALDSKLFWLMQAASHSIAEVQHVRDGFIHYFSDDTAHAEGFSDYARRELNDNLDVIRSLYLYLAREPLTKTRLR